MKPAFDTPLTWGLQELLRQLQERLQLQRPVRVYLAGGMGAHLYTGSRVTNDVDAEFSARVLLPSDLVVQVSMPDGQVGGMYFDTNYNSTFALMHEDYQQDALRVEMESGMLELYVLAPVDLVVSKIARLNDNDRQDIAALAHAGLVSAEDVRARAQSALQIFVGNVLPIQANIDEVCEMVREITAQHEAPDAPDGHKGPGIRPRECG